MIELDLITPFKEGGTNLYNQIIQLNKYKSEKGNRMLFTYIMIEKSDIIFRQQITQMRENEKQFSRDLIELFSKNSGIQRQINQIMRKLAKFKDVFNYKMPGKKQLFSDCFQLVKKIETLVFLFSRLIKHLLQFNQYIHFFDYFEMDDILKINKMVKKCDAFMIVQNDTFIFFDHVLQTYLDQINEETLQLDQEIYVITQTLKSRYGIREVQNQVREEFPLSLIFQSNSKVITQNSLSQLVSCTKGVFYYESPEIDNLFFIERGRKKNQSQNQVVI